MSETPHLTLDQRIRKLEIHQAVAAERERCAKIAEDGFDRRTVDDSYAEACDHIAARIRSGK